MKVTVPCVVPKCTPWRVTSVVTGALVGDMSVMVGTGGRVVKVAVSDIAPDTVRVNGLAVPLENPENCENW